MNKSICRLANWVIISIQESSADKLGAETYQTHCAGCHGINMEGGSSTTLLKTEWLYGRGKGDFIKKIKYGIADAD